MKDWVCKGFSINIFDRSMSKMKMKKGLLMTALITGTLMSSAVAFAEELQEYTLDQMVVTATRYEKYLLKRPCIPSLSWSYAVRKKKKKKYLYISSSR